MVSAFIILIFAELYECNGIWTSTPCDNPTSTVKSTKRSQSSEAKLPLEKRTAIHDMKMLYLKLKRETGITADPQREIAVCESPDTTITECSAVKETYSRDISLKLSNHRAITRFERQEKEENKNNKLKIQVKPGPGAEPVHRNKFGIPEMKYKGKIYYLDPGTHTWTEKK